MGINSNVDGASLGTDSHVTLVLKSFLSLKLVKALPDVNVSGERENRYNRCVVGLNIGVSVAFYCDGGCVVLSRLLVKVSYIPRL